MPDQEITPFEELCSEAAWAFARKCTRLNTENPYQTVLLDEIINTLMTELWDHGFSQTEIRSAFEKAAQDMPRYAAGEERRR
ncbi:MAG: hypothetical protein GY945_13175 [Rhodobacteraceae bacterium]|nr:hypothetical protein [Paracoccaceae bacterium]